MLSKSNYNHIQDFNICSAKKRIVLHILPELLKYSSSIEQR
jgi:hypothetical protein